MKERSYDVNHLLSELETLSPVERKARLESLGDPSNVVVDLVEETHRLVIADLPRAIGATVLVVALADALGDPKAKASARRARGQALAYSNRFEEALHELNDAAEIALRAHLPIEAAQARLTSVHALARLGRYEEALEAGEYARNAFTAAGEPLLAARADMNLGVTHRMRDDPATALQLFDRARPAFLGQPTALAQIDSNRAEALLDLNRFAEAEGAFSDALEAFQSAGAARAAAIVEGNLADLMSRQGRIEKALYHFERSRRQFEADASPGDLARLIAEQGEAMATAGMWEDAMCNYQLAIPQLREHGLAWEAARAGTGLGLSLLQLSRHREAGSVLNDAATAFQSLTHRTGYARIRRLQAEQAIANGDVETANTLLIESLTLLDDRPAEAAAAQYQLACLSLESGERARCQALLTAALNTAEQLNLAPLLADLLHARARLHELCGEIGPALDDLRAATKQIDRIRGSLQADRLRAAFLGSKTLAYEDLVALLLERGGVNDLEEAFSVIEQAKSRSLLDLVKGAIDLAAPIDEETADPGEAAILRNLARVQGELNALYRRWDVLAETNHGRPIETTWQEHILRCEREMAALENRLSATRGVGGLFAPPVDLLTAQRALEPNTALIEYFVARNDLLALVVRRDGVQAFTHLASSESLIDAIERFQFQIGRAVAWTAHRHGDLESLTRDCRRELSELYELTIHSLAEAIGDTQRLIIVPHGPLHAVPMHALWDGRRYLIEQHEVVYSPSASVLDHLRRTALRPSLAHGAPLVVGIPDALTPHIEEEVQMIRQVLSEAVVLSGDEATVERFAERSRDAPLIHLACHGRFSATAPLSSGLRLADRWLTVRDLYRLRLKAVVVTLSGCNTGLSEIGGGDELVGLLRGFLAAGTASVLCSLWTVSDLSAAQLMASVYRPCYTDQHGGSGLAARLRRAQVELLDRQPHPVFWAPFIQVGIP